MISREDCVCAGDIITYECSVIGGESTVFRGSALNCTNSEIILLHSRFSPSASDDSDATVNATANSIVCNEGEIVARGITVENGTYTSQLCIAFYNKLNGKSVSCIIDNGTTEISVGSVTLPTFTDVNFGKQ